MSCCKRIDRTEPFPCGDCYASCPGTERKGILILNAEQCCYCRNDDGCCVPAKYSNSRFCDTGLRPCQCAEEMVWNSNTPPKPNCEWLNNFSELRRQWSNHARQQNCKCCNCKRRWIMRFRSVKAEAEDKDTQNSRGLRGRMGFWLRKHVGAVGENGSGG